MSRETVSEEIMEMYNVVKRVIDEEGPKRVERKGDDVVVTTLGTGSALPSKYRNGTSVLYVIARSLRNSVTPSLIGERYLSPEVLSNLVQIPRWGNILLDAGEGTWGQIARRFGGGAQTDGEVEAILRDLRCVFISHIHGDHHMGLAKILALRQTVRMDAPIPFFCSSAIPSGSTDVTLSFCLAN